jgi:hypothetical protein
MRITSVSAGLMAVAVLLLTAPSHGQVQPMPGPGSGVVTVTGRVEIGNIPEVGASQRGEWRVALSHVPTIELAPLGFVKAGARYQIDWSNGDKEVVRVLQPLPGQWVRVESTQRPRYLNLSAARAIDEVP